jgi:hypothetical protein
MIKELGLKLKKAFTEKGFKIIEPYNGGAKKPAQGKKEISISVAEDHYNQFYNLHSNIQQYSVVKLKANTDHEKMPTYEKILLTANEENKDEVKYKKTSGNNIMQNSGLMLVYTSICLRYNK